MSAHQPYDLKQMQSVPLEGKILMTKERIRQWYEHWNGMVYVSFSGGKDSTVLKHIVDSMYDDVPAVFVNTGLEYPEIQRFAKSQKNVTVIRPDLRFDEVIKKYGYPVASKKISQTVETVRQGRNYGARWKMLNGLYKTKDGKPSQFNIEKWRFLANAPFDVSPKCCNEMKKKPFLRYQKQTGRKPIIGTMASEGQSRYMAWLKTGCNAFDGKNPSSQPLSFWTEQDILHYLKKYNVPYCSVYGDIVYQDADGNKYDEALFDDAPLTTTGCKRTGCIFCMFGCHLEKEPNRFQRLKETHPKQYNYCIHGGEMVDGKWQPSKEGLGLGHVLDYIGVKY